jgi:hypothetical protein
MVQDGKMRSQGKSLKKNAAMRPRSFDAGGAAPVHPIDRLAAVAKTAQFAAPG